MNCLTKEEFERYSKSPALVRQNSQSIQSPLSKNVSFNTAETGQPINAGSSPALADENCRRREGDASALDASAPTGARPNEDEQASNGNINSSSSSSSSSAAAAAAASESNKALALLVQQSVDYGK